MPLILFASIELISTLLGIIIPTNTLCKVWKIKKDKTYLHDSRMAGSWVADSGIAASWVTDSGMAAS